VVVVRWKPINSLFPIIIITIIIIIIILFHLSPQIQDPDLDLETLETIAQRTRYSPAFEPKREISVLSR